MTSLGTLTFPIIQQNVEQIVTVSEQGIIDAMKFIWERAKIIIEPSAAVPVGVLWEKKIDLFAAMLGTHASCPGIRRRLRSSFKLSLEVAQRCFKAPLPSRAHQHPVEERTKDRHWQTVFENVRQSSPAVQLLEHPLRAVRQAFGSDSAPPDFLDEIVDLSFEIQHEPRDQAREAYRVPLPRVSSVTMVSESTLGMSVRLPGRPKACVFMM